MQTPNFDKIVNTLVTQGLVVQITNVDIFNCAVYRLKRYAHVGFKHVAQVGILRSNGQEFVTTNPIAIKRLETA